MPRRNTISSNFQKIRDFFSSLPWQSMGLTTTLFILIIICLLATWLAYNYFSEGPSWVRPVGFAIFLIPWELLYVNTYNLVKHFTSYTRDFFQKPLSLRVKSYKLNEQKKRNIIILIIIASLYTIYLLLSAQFQNIAYRIENVIKYIIQHFNGFLFTFENLQTEFSLAIKQFSNKHLLQLTLIYIFGIIISRQSLRVLFIDRIKPLEDAFSSKLNQIYIKTPKLQTIIYVLVISITLSNISDLLRQRSEIVVNAPTENLIFASLYIDNIDIEKKEAIGNLSILEAAHYYTPAECDDWSDACWSEEGVPPIITEKGIVVNGQEKMPDGHYVYTQTVIKLSGNDYYFPFNKYLLNLSIKNANESLPKIEDYTKWEITTSNNTYTLSYKYNIPSGLPFFYIEYNSSYYYKALVIIVGLILLTLLLIAWGTRERGQLVELSLGIFAVIITLRGFLIPQRLGGQPLFLDQVLMAYLAIFFLTLLYKYNTAR